MKSSQIIELDELDTEQKNGENGAANDGGTKFQIAGISDTDCFDSVEDVGERSIKHTL